MAVIMIPNVIYSARLKGSEPCAVGAAVVICEQIGRYGCIAFMIFRVPHACRGFWFNHASAVYLSVNGFLCAAYLAFWAVCWNGSGRLKALSLSVIPSVIFLFSGIVLANIPLVAFALLFASSHIPISCKNAASKCEVISGRAAGKRQSKKRRRP